MPYFYVDVLQFYNLVVKAGYESSSITAVVKLYVPKECTITSIDIVFSGYLNYGNEGKILVFAGEWKEIYFEISRKTKSISIKYPITIEPNHAEIPIEIKALSMNPTQNFEYVVSAKMTITYSGESPYLTTIDYTITSPPPILQKIIRQAIETLVRGFLFAFIVAVLTEMVRLGIKR